MPETAARQAAARRFIEKVKEDAKEAGFKMVVLQIEEDETPAEEEPLLIPLPETPQKVKWDNEAAERIADMRFSGRALPPLPPTFEG